MHLAGLSVERGASRADPAPGLLDALDCLRVAVTVYDSAERLIYANAQYNYLFRQLPPQESLLGQTYAKLVAIELSSGEVDACGEISRYITLRRAQLHAADYTPFDIQLFDGRVVEIKTRRTKDGGWVALWTDATQARAFVERIEKRLARSESEVKKQAVYLADLTKRLDAASSGTDTAKTTLLRTMSHELKTPLNAIMGFAELMRSTADDISPEQISEYAGLVHAAGANLLRLITQILDLTRLAAGRYPLNRTALCVPTLFLDAMDMFAVRARDRQLTLDMRDCDQDIIVLADEGAAIAMIRNLVENAVNFTGAGGTVLLSARRAGDMVCLSVSDNGPGVSAEDLARIAEPFEQGERGITAKPDGAGLGLSLVKALAELQGGTLTLDSAPGKGFTATIELPAA